jgi:hypothetical protein
LGSEVHARATRLGRVSTRRARAAPVLTAPLSQGCSQAIPSLSRSSPLL